MKKRTQVISFIFVLAGFLFTNNLMAQEESETIKPMAEFNVTTYEFGKIQQGIPAKATFIVKNTSMVPLVITNVKPTCGCTVADYPKEPIRPGETGEIVATYNAKTPGNFTKTVKVFTNTAEGLINLYMKGEVIPKPVETE